MKRHGTVYLVGAGPGDAGLLTLRGAELLARADVVVYDALVNADLLRLAPKSAEIIFGGRRAKDSTTSRAQSLEFVITRAREGKTVVRLKGGDPFVFGRGGEEAVALADAGIAFEVVPGVSSFVAAPAYAGVPVTCRGFSSKLTLLTGHDDPASPDCAIDWAAEAKAPGTKVVLMGTERIGDIAATLVGNGLSAATPIALVSWGTTGHQRSIAGTLGTIADLAAGAGLPPPSVAVIGDVVKLRPRLGWFERRPLFGQRIVITRSREQAAQLRQPLAERGAEVLEIPTIRIAPPRQFEPLKDALLGLNSYDWLVFTSVNGVNAFFDYFFKAFDDLRDIGGVRIAAVGPATAARLREFHLKVDVMPEEYVATEVARALRAYESLDNLRICLFRAEVANPELPRLLEEAKAIVDDIALYRTVAETEDATGDAAKFREHGAEWVTFTSASTVEHFHARFDLPATLKQFPALRLASIGPETSKALRALGLEPAVEPRRHTMEGLVEAIERASRKPRGVKAAKTA